MQKSILLAFLMSIGLSVSAQWVTIPDANFANKLNELYPECMDGNQMNTECPGIVNETYLNVDYSNISDLTGINHFVNLQMLSCSHNNLTMLPLYLPPYLTDLHCDWNNISSIYSLPQYLTELKCDNNNLSQLTTLPSSLLVLFCDENNITSLPELPPTLDGLDCGDNNISTLPELPSSVTWLYCDNNDLTALPELPQSLFMLLCHNNELSCLPTLPISLSDAGTPDFNISGNPFTCLPNYVPAMNGENEEWLTFPLCDLGDLDNNPYGCDSFMGIGGSVFEDDDGNCEENGAENGVINATINLLNEEEDLEATTYTFGGENNTLYNLGAEAGSYTVQLVTEDMPFQVSCEDPGNTQSTTLTEAEPSALNLDFGIECLPGFDIGTQSVTTAGWVFPGQIHTLKIAAGDISSWYGLQCAEGVGGSVTVYVDGSVSYAGPASGALTPTVTGDLQFTYDVADFSIINMQQDFQLKFETDTTTEAGELVCVDIVVDPIDGDSNPKNNIYTH